MDMPESEMTAIRRQKSDVQKLRERIEDEYTSMRLGLSGLAAGVAKHQFIEARMHQVGTYEDQLATQIGEEQARRFSCQAYIQIMEGNE
jgi:hypothetical protein